MADTTSLTNFLNDVASAIKSKTGDSTAIPASQFDTKIRSIPTGGTYETINRTISDNGNITLLPSQGYDAIEQVNLTIQVSGGGSVPVKLFGTEQLMHNDPNPSMGDLALVYGDATAAWTQSTQSSTITFPSVVTLPSAYSSSAYPEFRAVDSSNMFYSNVQLSSSTFTFGFYTDQYDEYVQYTSSDGITYTRTDGGEESYDIGFDIYCSYGWDNVLGNFIQTGGKYFGGLFKYDTQLDETVLPIYSPSVDTSTSTGILTQVDTLPITTFYKFIQAVSTNTNAVCSEINVFMTSGKDKIIGYGYTNGSTLYSMSNYVTKYNDDWYLTGYSSGIGTGKRFEYNIQAETLSVTNWTTDMSIPVYSSSQMPQMRLQETYVLPIVGMYSGEISYLDYIYIGYCSDPTNPLHISPNFDTRITTNYPDKNDYFYAPTQLNLATVGQLLPGITGYGKKGLVTGDGSIYDNLDPSGIYESYYGLTPDNIDLYSGLNKDTTDYIVSREMTTSLFNNEGPIKLKYTTTKADVKAFAFERDNILFDEPQILQLLDDVNFSSTGESRYYDYHTTYVSKDGSIVGILCTWNTPTMYIIDVDTKTIVTSFTCYSAYMGDDKMMFMKTKTTYNSGDLKYYCYNFSTRTETYVCDIPVGTMNRASVTAASDTSTTMTLLMSPTADKFYIRTTGWNSGNTACKQNVSIVNMNDLTVTTTPEVSVSKGGSTASAGYVDIRLSDGFICGMCVQTGTNAYNCYLVKYNFDGTSTVLANTKTSTTHNNYKGFGIENNGVVYFMEMSGYKRVIKLEIGSTTVTTTAGNVLSSDIAIGSYITIMRTRNGEILYHDYQNGGLNYLRGVWNRITDMTIDGSNNSQITIDYYRFLPYTEDRTYADDTEVSLTIKEDMLKHAVVDFSESNTTKLTSQCGVITGDKIKVVPLGIVSTMDYEYTVINAMLGKSDNQVRLFTIQQKRGWETNADGSVDLIVSGDASVSNNTLIFNEEV